MKPLSERDENIFNDIIYPDDAVYVGMKPLSERDENCSYNFSKYCKPSFSRNEATLWKRWEQIQFFIITCFVFFYVGMKPLSERDENRGVQAAT